MQSMMLTRDNQYRPCCFVSCQRQPIPTGLQVNIWPPSDLPLIPGVAHEECFVEAKEPSVAPDLANERGWIPSRARCVFCGEKLPIIGRHPYALEVQTEESLMRYWAHAACVEDILDLNRV
jgi:hypothetical protein